jgi:hypothetical protein
MVRMERQTGNGSDSVTHEPTTVVVLDDGTQFPIVATVDVDVLTHRTAANVEPKVIRNQQK